jgi:hypothetical protein
MNVLHERPQRPSGTLSAERPHRQLFEATFGSDLKNSFPFLCKRSREGEIDSIATAWSFYVARFAISQ